MSFRMCPAVLNKVIEKALKRFLKLLEFCSVRRRGTLEIIKQLPDCHKVTVMLVTNTYCSPVHLPDE